MLPVPVTPMVWPEAMALSAAPELTLGQRKLTPLRLTVPPGLAPACARACAESEAPPPSKFPTLVLLSLVMPTLLKLCSSVGVATPELVTR